MTTITTQAVATAICPGGQTAVLVEERLYPSDWLDDANAPFQVRIRFCDQQEECRAANRSCRWTGLNPNFDPFEG
jgi:hypothetical protein